MKRPALVFYYVFGTIYALVLGMGMSLVMDVIEASAYCDISIGKNTMISGVVIGLAGILMVITNYTIYKGILGVRRKKYADKIVALSDKIMKG